MLLYMRNCLLAFLCCILSLPLYAQWGRYGLRAGWRDLATQLQQANLPAQQLRKALGDAAQQAVGNSLPMELEKSVLQFTEGDAYMRSVEGPLTGSAFVLETEIGGQKQLWGVSAGHYFFKTPIVQFEKKTPAKVLVVAKGATGMTDVSLFLLPHRLVPYVKPLKLATENPKEGENLFSIGYFENQFHVETNRIVNSLNNQRLITTLAHDPCTNRTGACGGPVLNNKGEVVGVHVGSSGRQQIGFVVPLDRIRQLLRAYYNNGEEKEDLIFQGKKIGEISINEHIFQILFYKNGHEIIRVPTFHRENEIDYAHLETWIEEFPEADTIIFELCKYPFSPVNTEEEFTKTRITYKLKTAEVSLKEEDLYADPDTY